MEEAKRGPQDRYPQYVLGVLVLVYIFNFLDRQIISILAERIKADLGLSDDQIGFLYGTAFAIFYALFGIPLGRLADVWNRRTLIALGLSFWSVMTALSGFARNFAELAAARIGVGIGEASATPAAFSLLSDYFPVAKRATVLAVYSSGIYVGAGLGLGIGGLIVERWDAAWAGAAAPFGLRGWQVAFFAVGLPGLLLALWVRSLREPVRGQLEGMVPEPEPHPFREFGKELRAVIPPFTLLHVYLTGGGVRGLATNLAFAGGTVLGAFLLYVWLGSAAQWVALGLGVYAALSWAQALRIRDFVSFDLIFRTPTLRWAVLGFAFLAFTGYGYGFWTAPFFLREHGITESQAGPILGGIAAVGGWLGTILGGTLADRWRHVSINGRLWVGVLTATVPIPLALWMLNTSSLTLAYVLNFPLALMAAMWIGPGASTITDLVLPRMRASASAAYLLVVTFIGLAMGPYTIGRLSVGVESLRLGMMLGLGANAIALACLLLAARSLARDEATLRDRARAAGEKSV